MRLYFVLVLVIGPPVLVLVGYLDFMYWYSWYLHLHLLYLYLYLMT